MLLEPKPEKHTTNKVPNPILWVRKIDTHCTTKSRTYAEGYRSISFYSKFDYNIKLLVRSSASIAGRVVWLVLDTSNGNPELPEGKSYIWLFNTKKQAEAQIALHKKHGYAVLSKPYKYVVADAV